MNNFINDVEKMHDFKCLTKSDFLKSYSYLTEEEYDATKNETHEDSSSLKWTVWVGGTEVTDNYVNRDTADSILTDYLHKGYDQNDVWIEEVA